MVPDADHPRNDLSNDQHPPLKLPFANDLMAFISPSVRIAALGYESQHDRQNIAHRRTFSD